MFKKIYYLLFIILLIGNFSKASSLEQEGIEGETPIESLEIADKDQEIQTKVKQRKPADYSNGLVTVEGLPTMKPNPEGLLVVPYSERRSNFGGNVSFGVENYFPNELVVQNTRISDSLNSESSLMYTVHGAIKYHISDISVGLDLGVGHYSVEANGSEITMTSYQVAGKVILEPIFLEPYIVPFAMAGYYLKQGTITNATEELDQLGLFWAFGAQIQLDWFDRKSAAVSLIDNGVENTFIYIEFKNYMAGTRDFKGETESSHFGAGLKLEL